MNIDDAALRAAEGLPVPAYRRLYCPVCNGGGKHEKSWVVGREADRVWFKCFRAKCAGSTGVVGSHSLPPAVAAERSRALERMRPYYLPVRALAPADEAYFAARFELARAAAGTLICTTDFDEYILPVRGPNFQLRGHVVRQPVWKGMPKAPRLGRTWDPDANEGQGGLMPKTKLYPCTTQPQLAWYRSTGLTQVDPRHIVLVEDQISAIKCAQEGIPTVALLGNGLNIEGVRDILRQKPRVVTIALDPGAEGQAQNLAKKWGLYFEKTRVVALEADPKDIPAADLLEELGV